MPNAPVWAVYLVVFMVCAIVAVMAGAIMIHFSDDDEDE
jgi:hypothetical protein